MRIIFFGSDEFALEHFNALLKSGFAIMALVTQPDRPQGRGFLVSPGVLKVAAQKHNIEVLQPQSVREPGFIAKLKSLAPDFLIVIAYGQILPRDVLSLAKIMPINVHGSLLPQLRGAAPIQWAIINGLNRTGYSLIRMNERMDQGDIIVQEEMEIHEDDNSQTLRERMARKSALCLCRILDQGTASIFSFTAQDKTKVSYAPKLTKSMGNINWQKSARDIHNLVRGLNPWPGAYTICQGKQVKIYQTGYSENDLSGQTPGLILTFNQTEVSVSTGKGTILLKQVQPQSGKVMSAYSWALGQRLIVGKTVLESIPIKES